MAAQSGAVLPSLLRSQISGQDAVGTSRCCSFRKFLQTHLQEGIEITEKHERDVRARTEMANEFKYAGESCSAAQRAFARTLNDGAIRNWIAEGDTEFD